MSAPRDSFPDTPKSAAKRKITCRYVELNARPCTAEAADENASVRLCPRHLGLVLEEHLPAVLDRLRAGTVA